ncbi:uncharacterized protein LOC125187962 [Salvia hispanica]|uniref:uncharacterized protein LOC125187962 n=1 Tax=Salvia hispanica TaxID=49212 RepID=UPI002009D172|nr:uncharacterized protein LOC125187962 [Salvia hispanica]
MANSHGGGGMPTAEDYQEEEVWAMINARDQPSNLTNNLSTSSSRHFPSTAAARGIPRSASSSSSGGASSAPLAVPDWSKILKKNPKRNGACGNFSDGDDEMVPPHEYVARRAPAAQVASFSMCEGVGRTLKGRDLSRLRNAILTKTGFLE